MTEPKPPDQVLMLWCPACGYHRPTEPGLRTNGAHVHEQGGGTCTMPRKIVTYGRMLKTPGALPEVPGTAQFRAALQLSCTVSPALPHLNDGPSSQVGRVLLLGGSHPEQLAMMVQMNGPMLITGMTNLLAVHPRPDPHDGWLRR